MKALIEFLLAMKNTFLFLLLELICVLLVVKNNNFQRFGIMTSCNYLTGWMYEMRENVVRYFSLSSVNDNLAKQNTKLQQEITLARKRIAELESDTSYIKRTILASQQHYRFVTAKVINISSDRLKNILTIDKGRMDGVRQNMGVICPTGAIGIVTNVSEHFALVLPIINTATKMSACVKGKNSSSTLQWESADVRFASLSEVPLYVPVADGDTVVTSGYSSIFPADLMLGVIESHNKGNDDFHEIQVRLSTDFSSLSYVDVLEFINDDEKSELESEIEKEGN